MDRNHSPLLLSVWFLLRRLANIVGLVFAAVFGFASADGALAIRNARTTVARLAQLVERQPFKLVVVGSSPTVGTLSYLNAQSVLMCLARGSSCSLFFVVVASL